MWGWRRVTVPPASDPELALPVGLVSVTVPSDQIQRGSELTSPMLESQKMANRSKRELIRKVMGQAKDKHSNVFIERIPRNIVIAFVEKLEKTHQHLDIREYLLTNCDFIKYDSDANLMVEQILGGQEGKRRFYGYYKEVIRRSVQEHISLLNLEKKLNANLPDLQYSGCKDMSKVEKLFKPSCPVSELVFRTRREDFVMDINPEVELEKMKTSEPYFYDMEFITRPPPMDYISVKSKTVRVVDVPPDTSEREVMDLLSDCGDIERIQMIRDIEIPDEPQHADVTFTEIEGRDNALAKDLKIDNQPIRITTRDQIQVVYLSQPVDVRVGSEAEPAKEKAEGDVDRMLHVLNRYWFCCQRFCKSNLLAVESAVDDTTQK